MSGNKLPILDENTGLSEAAIRQIAEKVAQGCRLGFAEVVLVIEKGRLRWIRGPAPSEPIRQ
jgi:hypothetical protein